MPAQPPPRTLLREKSSLCCRSGQLPMTSGSSVSSQSTRSPEHGPSRTASRLQGGGGLSDGLGAAHGPAARSPGSPAAVSVLLPHGRLPLLLQQQGAHHCHGPGGWEGGGG